MTVFERMGRAADRMFDRMRDRRAFTLTEESAIDGDLESLRGAAYAVLVTFRRNGDPMPSPVWFGIDEQRRVYVKTRNDTGKVKRLRNDSSVLLAPSSSRGKPTGAAIRGTGRPLPRDEWQHAEATIAAAYGRSRAISERVIGGPEDLAAYIEIVRRG